MELSSNMENGAGGRLSFADIRKIEQSSGLAAAERAVVEFLVSDPKSTQAFVALSRLLRKQQKYDDALRAAEKARGLAPLEVEPVIAEGFVHVRKQDHEAATRVFAEAINLDPGSARAHVGAAAVKFAAEDYDAALEIIDRALKTDPSMERAFELKARILIKKGDKAGAAMVLQHLVGESPRNDRALKAYMRLMRADGRGEEAYDFIAKDAAAHPGDRVRATRLAKVALRSGKPDIAVEQTRKFVEAGSKRPDDGLRYISALIESKRFEEAEKEIAALGEKRIMAPIAAKLRGDMALKAEKPEEAIAFYRQSCRVARLNPLKAEDEKKGETAQQRAKLWRSHNRRALSGLVRERLQNRG